MANPPTQGSKLFFLNGTPNAGLPGTSALDELAYPPQSAIDAETWSDDQAHAVGVVNETAYNALQAQSYRNQDTFRDLADHQSIIQGYTPDTGTPGFSGVTITDDEPAEGESQSGSDISGV